MTKNRSINQKHSLVHDVHEYSVNFDKREIFLHSWCSSEEESGVDYKSAITLGKNLAILSSFSNSPITVHMQIVGGNWHDGMAIYNYIRSCINEVTIKGYGHVGSMSSIILQAADKRLISENCEFLVHFGSIGLEANSMAAKSMIDWNEKCNEKMLEIYASRCENSKGFKGKDCTYRKNYIKKKIKDTQEWYMSSEEAVYYGLADGIIKAK